MSEEQKTIDLAPSEYRRVDPYAAAKPEAWEVWFARIWSLLTFAFVGWVSYVIGPPVQAWADDVVASVARLIGM